MFREEMPKIYELRVLIRDPTALDAYFQNFKSALRDSPSAIKKFTDLERELEGLDPEAWAFLKNEASSYLKRKDSSGRGWQQLFDILNQARAYNYLTRIGSSNVRFVPPSSSPTPDLEGLLDGRRVLCEVKTINASKTEVQARVKRTARQIKNYLEDGFFVKFRSDIDKAKNQMSAFDSTGQSRWFVYFNLCFDDFFGEYEEQYFRQIDDYLSDKAIGSDNPVEGIHVVYKIDWSSFRGCSGAERVFVCLI